MKNTLVAVAALLFVAATQNASAQEVRGFAFAGTTSDSNSQRFPAVGGGVTVDLGQPWLAAGAQGETFFELPYFAGRGAVFAEGRILPRSTVRPLVIAGYGFGEDAGPLVGAGIGAAPVARSAGVQAGRRGLHRARSDLPAWAARTSRDAASDRDAYRRLVLGRNCRETAHPQGSTGKEVALRDVAPYCPALCKTERGECMRCKGFGVAARASPRTRTAAELQ